MVEKVRVAFRAGAVVAYVGIALIALSIYLFTAAPSLTWSHWGSDGGDFVTAAVTGRVPHPPGFPLYFILARLLVSLVRYDPARVLNILSAIMAVAAIVAIAATLRRFKVSWWATASASLTLAFAPWFWSQALITEVYTSAACLVSIMLWLVSGVEGKWMWLGVGLALGLAVSIHPTTALLLVLVLFMLRGPWWVLVLGLALGLLPYAVLPLFSPWPQPWGDLRLLDGWWRYVTAQLYWGNAFALPLHRWPERVLAWAVLLIRQVTPLGALLILAGGRELWRRRRSWFVGSFLALSLMSVYAIGYNTVDSWVYLVAFLPLLVVPLGLGLDWLFAHGVPAKLALVLPLLLLVLNYRSLSLHDDRTALIWLSAMIDQLPEGAVVLTDRDDYTFALWYATEAPITRFRMPVSVRPDLLVVDTRFWGYDPYRSFLARRTGRLVAQSEDLAHNRPLCNLEDEKVICP